MEDHINLAVVAADDALITRISAGIPAEDDITELEQLLVAWRNAYFARSMSP